MNSGSEYLCVTFVRTWWEGHYGNTYHSRTTHVYRSLLARMVLVDSETVPYSYGTESVATTNAESFARAVIGSDSREATFPGCCVFVTDVCRVTRRKDLHNGGRAKG